MILCRATHGHRPHGETEQRERSQQKGTHRDQEYGARLCATLVDSHFSVRLEDPSRRTGARRAS